MDMNHIYSEAAEGRCINCDCRPYGKWASLPCGTTVEPADIPWDQFVALGEAHAAATQSTGATA